MRLLACLAGTLLSIGLLMAPTERAYAQTISQPNDAGAVGAPWIGQSFTATVNGTVTVVRVRPSAAQSGKTIAFYSGTGNGVGAAIGTPLYQQSGIDLVDTTSPAFQTIVLTTPLPVVGGTVYTFLFSDATTLRATTDVYASGSAVITGNATVPSVDFAFEILQAAAPYEVPTLSEWAMIVLVLSLAGVGVAMVRRRTA